MLVFMCCRGDSVKFTWEQNYFLHVLSFPVHYFLYANSTDKILVSTTIEVTSP